MDLMMSWARRGSPIVALPQPTPSRAILTTACPDDNVQARADQAV
jgi:hypothetical protein